MGRLEGNRLFDGPIRENVTAMGRDNVLLLIVSRAPDALELPQTIRGLRIHA